MNFPKIDNFEVFDHNSQIKFERFLFLKYYQTKHAKTHFEFITIYGSDISK